MFYHFLAGTDLLDSLAALAASHQGKRRPFYTPNWAKPTPIPKQDGWKSDDSVGGADGGIHQDKRRELNQHESTMLLALCGYNGIAQYELMDDIYIYIYILL